MRDGDHELNETDAAKSRSAAGSVMYVAQDRPDCLYATESVMSFMQKPTKAAMAQLKREVRDVMGFPRAERVYGAQKGMPTSIDVFGDSAWAGDEVKKRSTTGVAELLDSPS